MENNLYQLLLPRIEAVKVAEAWLACDIEADLRLRKSKTRGYVVIETENAMYARNIQSEYPSCEWNIKDMRL